MFEFFWDRYVEVQVESTVFTLDDVDIEFTVENDDKSKAGTAEVALYNLASSKSALKKDKPIQIKAGYKQDYGVVFYGKIDKVWDERDGADLKTIIQASDLTKDLFMAKPICKKYPKGTPVVKIVKDMFVEAGIPPGKIEDPGITLQKDMVFGGITTSTPHTVLEDILLLVNGYNVKGVKLDGALARIAEVTDTYTWYIGQDGMGYFVKRKYGETAIVLDSESGLIEVQDVSKEGETSAYRVRCIFNWKIKQGGIVQLNSITVSGNFKVSKFKHVCKEEYYTEAEVSPL